MRRVLTALCLMTFLPGCGTIVNLSAGRTPILRIEHAPPGPTEVYGGVWNDIEGLQNSNLLGPAFTAALLADLSLSIAADTLTLPVTVPIAYLNQQKEAAKQEEGKGIWDDTERGFRKLNAQSSDEDILQELYGVDWQQTNQYKASVYESGDSKVTIRRTPSGKTSVDVLLRGYIVSEKTFELSNEKGTPIAER